MVKQRILFWLAAFSKILFISRTFVEFWLIKFPQNFHYGPIKMPTLVRSIHIRFKRLDWTQVSIQITGEWCEYRFLLHNRTTIAGKSQHTCGPFTDPRIHRWLVVACNWGFAFSDTVLRFRCLLWHRPASSQILVTPATTPDNCYRDDISHHSTSSPRFGFELKRIKKILEYQHVRYVITKHPATSYWITTDIYQWFTKIIIKSLRQIIIFWRKN